MSKEKDWQTRLAELKLALLSKQYIDCKWWQFKKKRQLMAEAKAIAKKHNIKF